MTRTLSPLRAQRREKILDAAQALFLKDGVRATTIEGLASAAGMSKVTVYGYFDDKDAVFQTVSDRVAASMERVFHETLHADTDIKNRIGQALIAKHTYIHELVRSSAHAKEIFQSKDQINAARFIELDKNMVVSIAGILSSVTQESDALARLLFDASQGIANGAKDVATLETSIQMLMKLVPDGP